MTSYTSWLRFEPRPRAASLEGSFEARVHDPLWLLGRQWQLGEIQGEDAGTPVQLRMEVADVPLDAVAVGSTVRSYDPSRQPLEMIVEQEQQLKSTTTAWRRASLDGLQFLRMLAGPLRVRYRNAIVARYALTLPAGADPDHPLDRAFELITAGRLPDGFAMAAEWAPWLEGRQAAPSFVDRSDLDPFADTARRWIAWRKAVLAQPADAESAWLPSALRYAVSVSAANPAAQGNVPRLALEAADYRGGRLDWYSFDAGATSPFARQPVQKPRRTAHSFLPTTMAFRGMPAARWWEFEDGTVALGNTDVAPEDLGRLLLLEFAFCYANDYFIVPLPLTPGSLCRIEQLTAVNTFGDVIAVGPLGGSGAGAKPWRMFTISAGADDQLDAFFLCPALAPTVDSERVEEVFLARDETANVIWAIERIVESPAGYASPRQERARRDEEPPTTTQPADRWNYTLASRVPDGWLPYVPVQLPRVNGVRSRSVALQRVSARPSSALLRTPGAELLNEEEVPRRGVRITRAYQLARWTNGETYVWGTREVRAGRGETASGLRFDALTAGAAD